ncbi:MFS transporter [uncultured Pseudokineococcus sp.]|uniref:MFS transporter n=1 Tax=uncultured Pseudokineococcus sp. TaxID=1642928 RepID=UPI002623D315|nr:MFS transporter [uncultured Pseudokineococcus sp.]
MTAAPRTSDADDPAVPPRGTAGPGGSAADGAGRAEGAPTGGAARQRRDVPHWMVLVVAATAQFMVILDVSIVNVALPSMRTDLDLSTAGLQWVVNAYALAFAGLLLLGGRAGDLFGRKRVFLLGVGLFSLASLVGGFAQTEAWLVAARAAQGVGGAVLAPATLSLLTTTYTEPGERARALGVWGAVGGAGGAMGGLVGGVLTEALSWRWVLFVNVPLGVLLAAGAAWALVGSTPVVRRLRDLDVPGSLTVTLGLTSVVYGVVSAETRSWTSAVVLVPITVGLALLALFVVVERHAPRPLVPLAIFRRRALSAANGVALTVGMGMFSFWFFMSLQLQRVYGFDALGAGLAFLPASLTLIAGSMASTRIARRTGPRPLLVVGPLVSASGLLWLSTSSPSGSYLGELLLPTMLSGLGIGLTMVQLAAAATAGVPGEQAGLASGLINTSRQMGGAIGLAVLSTVAAARTAAVLGTGDADAAASAGPAGVEALAAGYDRGLLVGAAIVACGALVGLLVPAERRARAGDAERDGIGDDAREAVAD